jgi:trans-aconitate methyltransferase
LVEVEDERNRFMTDPASGGSNPAAPTVDVTRPSIARVYDLFLGGKDNYESDRVLYRQIMEIAPEIPEWARENRRWLTRVVTWLAREARIEQYLDCGSGLPTAQNTHQIAQGINPSATVVYVDNDPSVIVHGQALLVNNDRTSFAAADLTDPAAVLADPAVTDAFDPTRPIALVQALVLHHIQDTDEAREIVAAYVDALPSGSYLAISHASNPRDGSEAAELSTAIEEKFKASFQSLNFRTPEEIASLFDGLELLEPGVVRLFDWWPPGSEHDDDSAEGLRPDASLILYGGLARKP